MTLTAREYDLLDYFLSHPSTVRDRDHLLLAVWGSDYRGTSRTVDNFVRKLRSALEKDPAKPEHILSVRGAGYKFIP